MPRAEGNWRERRDSNPRPCLLSGKYSLLNLAGADATPEPDATVSSSGSPRSSLRTTSARMHQNVCLLVFAFLPLPFPCSYVVLTRLPSTSTCEPFLMVDETYSASRGRNTETRCHSVFEAHSSSVFFHDRDRKSTR